MLQPNAEPVTLPIFRIEPPYEQMSLWRQIMSAASDPPTAGSVCAIPMDAPERDWHLLEHWVQYIQRTYPSTPVVLLFVTSCAHLAPGYAMRAAGLGVRAAIIEGEPLGASLRRWLASPANIGSDVASWIILRGATVSPGAQKDIANLVNAASSFRKLRNYLTSRRRNHRSLGKRFERLRLPSPGEWFRLGRALFFAFRIQRSPATSILTAALELGYEDASTIHWTLKRSFNVSPALIRNTLGWEWMLDRWWKNVRHGRRRA